MTIEPGSYLTKGQLKNETIDIGEDELHAFHRAGVKEKKENQKVTLSTYLGDSYFDQGGDFHYNLMREYGYRDRKTSGVRMQYPHGIVIRQAMFRDYFRGENQIHGNSVPTLLRSLALLQDKDKNSGRSENEIAERQELYRLVADMRIGEFRKLMDKFQHVREWTVSDVLYEALAQHYGLETCWQDVTTDFDVALFFATCTWDKEKGWWRPLTDAEIRKSEKTQYGMIIHMPSWYMEQRWGFSIDKFGSLDKGLPENLIYPIGFQPFMRCSMQNGYGIYMRKPKPLEEDIGFEKLRFRQSAELSQKVFDMMDGGRKIYPHEGLNRVGFLIDQIQGLTDFSEEAFQYALARNHRWRVDDESECREKLTAFEVDGHPITIRPKEKNSFWHLSGARRKRIDAIYDGFDAEQYYGIRAISRPVMAEGGGPAGAPMYEPYMLTDDVNERGIRDFKPRPMESGVMNMWTYTMLHMMRTMVTASAKDF